MPHICEMVVGTVCNFRGQMIVGNFQTPWLNAGANTVGWSKIGHAEFVLDRSNEAGQAPMPGHGEVLMVKPLRKAAVAYGSGSIMALYPVAEIAPTFGFEVIKDRLGIAGRGAVGGDLDLHLVMDTFGRLWLLDSELKFQRLGYEHIFKPKLDDDETVIISYDRAEQEFYIGTDSAGYVFNPEGGLSEIDKSPTDVWNYEQELYASFKEFTSSGSTIMTGLFDFGISGIKTITGVEIGGDVNSSDMARVHFKTDRTEHFRTSNWKRFSPTGDCAIRASGVEMKVEVQFSREVEELEYLTVKYQIPDKRGIRGVYASEND